MPDLRPIEPEEFDALLRVMSIAFHQGFRPSEREEVRAILEFDRMVGAFDGGELVGTSGLFTQRLSVPGGEVDCASVTMVAVLPSHRRRGLLTGMMTSLLAQARERAEPVAALWASEGAIYGRFGFAVANRAVDLRIEQPRRVAFERGPAGSPVRLTQLSESAGDHLRPVFDRVRATRPGVMSRSDAWWRAVVLTDAEDQRRNFGPKFVAQVDDGYAIYRVEEDVEDTGSVPLEVVELFAATPAAYSALWRYLCSIDLIETIKAPLRPLDEPLPLLLVDQRLVRVAQMYDVLWLRLLDLPAALERRGWAAETSVVLEVHDAGMPHNAGVWDLRTGADGGRCERTDRPPELVLDVRDLAAVYLGGASLGGFVAAGVVEERAAGAADRLDSALRVPLAPWTAEGF
jgi:predicted acetyltransferase